MHFSFFMLILEKEGMVLVLFFFCMIPLARCHQSWNEMALIIMQSSYALQS